MVTTEGSTALPSLLAYRRTAVLPGSTTSDNDFGCKSQSCTYDGRTINRQIKQQALAEVENKRIRISRVHLGSKSTTSHVAGLIRLHVVDGETSTYKGRVHMLGRSLFRVVSPSFS